MRTPMGVLMTAGLWLAASLAAGGAGIAAHAPAPPAKDGAGGARLGKILFLGNSITLHGPRPQIGWTDNWGMAASSRDKDYVHVLARSIAALTGTAPEIMVENIVEFERNYETYDPARLKSALDFRADLVIVAIGENVPTPVSDEAEAKFEAGLLKLLTAVRDAGNPAIVVRSSFWPNTIKDRILEKVCADVGGVFVDISALGRDESNRARAERRFEHSGVAAHPGDKGMQAIADALLAAITRIEPEKP